jgi:hypothetical protein
MNLTFLLVLIFSFNTFAAPILNKNMAAEGTLVTIWPDHSDPNHFYFAPNFMKIALNNSDQAKFHFTQYRTGNCSSGWSIRRGHCHHKALITSLFIAGHEFEQLSIAQAGILKLNPRARFSAISFISSQVDFGQAFGDFIDSHDCSPRAGQAADEIPCNITLNRRGVKSLMPFLNNGRILPFKFIYRIAGVVEGANGHFTDEVLDYGLTVNLGGDALKNHPDLSSSFLWDE